MENDPTEAIQSAEIPGVIKQIVPRVDVTRTYGTLCLMLFWCLLPDPIYETEQGRNLVKFIVEVETALVDSGRLPSYFDYLIGFKPPRPG